MDLKIKVLEFTNPSLLFLTQIFLIKKILEAIMVAFDDEWATHKILFKFLQCIHDGQHHLIIHAKILFYTSQFYTFKCNRLPFLCKNCSHTKLWCITFHYKRDQEIWYGQIGVVTYQPFQNFESFLWWSKITLSKNGHKLGFPKPLLSNVGPLGYPKPLDR